METKILYDDFGNKAIIEARWILPYRGAAKKEKSYRLTLQAIYNDNFTYFASVYETEEQAMEKLKEFSCNTWK